MHAGVAKVPGVKEGKDPDSDKGGGGGHKWVKSEGAETDRPVNVGRLGHQGT